MSLMWKGARAGNILLDQAKMDEAAVWKLLADIWTEIIVYVAPSSEEVHVKAHGDALAHGDWEFITVLWALTMHTGVTWPSDKPWAQNLA
uniref:Uncharacterized protein n=1 Tax=Leersia perrieri TaxID=77586 RepID=A0A0D9WL75_9ORYZ